MNHENQSIAEAVAESALSQYQVIVNKNKGRGVSRSSNGKYEYTVLSSIVLLVPLSYFETGTFDPLNLGSASSSTIDPSKSPSYSKDPDLFDHSDHKSLDSNQYHYLPLAVSTGLKTQPFNNLLTSSVASKISKEQPIPTQQNLQDHVKSSERADRFSQGDILHDSHSEVLTRRGVRKWLCERLKKEIQIYPEILLGAMNSQGGRRLGEQEEVEKVLIEGLPRIFEPTILNDTNEETKDEDQRFKLRDGIKTWFYVSTLPCGDASMKLMKREKDLEDLGTNFSSEDQDLGEAETQTSIKDSENVLQTFEECGTLRGREQMDKPGRLRTKPGRPDSPPSLSHSCSDKLSFWSILGFQGSILSNWLLPIRIDGYVFGDGEVERVRRVGVGLGMRSENFREQILEELRRSLWSRWEGWLKSQQDSTASPSNEELISQPDIKLNHVSIISDSISRFLSSFNFPTPPSIHLTSQVFSGSYFSVLSKISSRDQNSLTSFSPQDHVTTSTLSLSYIHPSTNQGLIEGLKQGASAKRKNGEALDRKRRAAICKLEWFGEVRELRLMLREDSQMEEENETYWEMKRNGGRGGKEYREVKAWLRGDLEDEIQGDDVGDQDGLTLKSRLFVQDFFRKLKGQEIGIEMAKGDQGPRRGEEEGERKAPFEGWLISGKRFESFDERGGIVF